MAIMPIITLKQEAGNQNKRLVIVAGTPVLKSNNLNSNVIILNRKVNAPLMNFHIFCRMFNINYAPLFPNSKKLKNANANTVVNINGTTVLLCISVIIGYPLFKAD